MTDEQLKIISDYCRVFGRDYHEVEDAIEETIMNYPIASGKGELCFYVLYLYTHHYDTVRLIYHKVDGIGVFIRDTDGLHFNKYIMFREEL
jgi:hypothetical protein